MNQSVSKKTFDRDAAGDRPVLAITMGDAAGVGPEVIAAAWKEPALHEACAPVVIGDPGAMRKAAALRGLKPVEVLEVDSPPRAPLPETVMPCLAPQRDNAEMGDFLPGLVSAQSGAAAYAAIRAAGDLALRGEVDGIVTAPINKKALREAGIDFPGHTELFAEMCGVRDFAMMLYRPAEQETHITEAQQQASPGLGVAHVTLHMALRDIFEHLSTSAIVAKAKLLHGMLLDLHGAAPRLAVAALNPHAGETGLFGREEIELIAPAVAKARAEGLTIDGPHAADTLFRHAAAGKYEGVVAMYHDQGHIALKLLGMHEAVNVTLGLPIVRTSVAHGTAFDIAWQGIAAPDSLLQAARVAAKLAVANRAKKL